jgi:hypothetical protein
MVAEVMVGVAAVTVTGSGELVTGTVVESGRVTVRRRLAEPADTPAETLLPSGWGVEENTEGLSEVQVRVVATGGMVVTVPSDRVYSTVWVFFSPTVRVNDIRGSLSVRIVADRMGDVRRKPR